MANYTQILEWFEIVNGGTRAWQVYKLIKKLKFILHKCVS